MRDQNKTHWYDGWFYDRFIAPNQDRLFGQIKTLIEQNSKIIDVGCGTGRFSFSVADTCKSVLGIDLSKRNIERANLNLSKNPNHNLSFKNQSVSDLVSEGNKHFDYAVMTYVIHEVNEEERANLLSEISCIADKIIIGDYLVPKPRSLWSILNELIEFVAGKEHYKNYKNFNVTGGLNYYAKQAELKVITEINNQPLTSHLVVLTK